MPDQTPAPAQQSAEPVSGAFTVAPTRRRPKRWIRFLAVGIALASLTSLVVTASQPGGRVRQDILGLADRIIAVAADYHVGPYTYIHVQSWTRQPNNTIGRVDVEHWQHINGTAHTTTRRASSWPQGHRATDGSDRPDFTAAVPQTYDYPAYQGGEHLLTPETVSTDPTELTAQLVALRGTTTSTDDLLFDIVDIQYTAYLGRDQRAAVLRLIAGLPTVVDEGESTDIAGRRGITFRFTDTAATTWLIINPATGEVLSYRRAFNDPQATFSAYSLLLDRDRRRSSPSRGIPSIPSGIFPGHKGDRPMTRAAAASPNEVLEDPRAGGQRTMARIPVALFNYQDGGRQPDGGYTFRPLQRAFSSLEVPPALILFCEAKNYRDRAGEAKYAAAEALSDQLGVPYSVELGSMSRGPLPPAIFYNPDVLILRRWWNQDDPGVYDDQRNVARFAVRSSGATAARRIEFLAFVHHFEPLSGDARLEEARRVSRYGSAQSLPVIGGGDLNAIRFATSGCLTSAELEAVVAGLCVAGGRVACLASSDADDLLLVGGLGRSQPVVATPTNSAIFSLGVAQPKVRRGRLLSSSATASSCA